MGLSKTHYRDNCKFVQNEEDMRASEVIWATTLVAISFLPQSLAHSQNDETAKAIVYLNDSDKPVEDIEVYARFVTGDELNELQKLIGVSTEMLENESKFSQLELYRVCRIKASSKARGVPCLVKLQLANDSKILHKLPLIEVATLFPDELQILMIKVSSLGRSRDGETGMGAWSGKKWNAKVNDLIGKLHKEKPIFRLRSMIIK